MHSGVGFDLETIKLQFDRDLQASEIGPGDVQLVSLGADQKPGGDDALVAVSTVAVDKDKLTLTPQESLLATSYRLRIAGAALVDTNSERVSEDLVLTFSHVAPVADTVQWIAPAGNWEDASNWSTGEVPTIDDVILIEIPGIVADVEINGGHTVRSAQIHESLTVVSGQLTVTGDVEVHGPFTLEPGAALAAQRDGHFSALGSAVIDGGSLYAEYGGRIDLPTVDRYLGNTTGNSQRRYIQATGHR